MAKRKFQNSGHSHFSGIFWQYTLWMILEENLLPKKRRSLTHYKSHHCRQRGTWGTGIIEIPKISYFIYVVRYGNITPMGMLKSFQDFMGRAQMIDER